MTTLELSRRLAEILRRDIYIENDGNEPESERPYRAGWNDRSRALLLELEMCCPRLANPVETGLVELRDAEPVLPRHWLAEVP